MNLYDYKVSLLASINREQEILDNKINFIKLTYIKGKPKIINCMIYVYNFIYNYLLAINYNILSYCHISIIAVF